MANSTISRCGTCGYLGSSVSDNDRHASALGHHADGPEDYPAQFALRLGDVQGFAPPAAGKYGAGDHDGAKATRMAVADPRG